MSLVTALPLMPSRVCAYRHECTIPRPRRVRRRAEKINWQLTGRRMACNIFSHSVSMHRSLCYINVPQSHVLGPNSTTRTPAIRTCCTTPPTDELTTILQQICLIAMPEPNISTCQDVGMWQIFIRWWWICCTTSCRIVLSSSVSGVRSRCRV